MGICSSTLSTEPADQPPPNQPPPDIQVGPETPANMRDLPLEVISHVIMPYLEGDELKLFAQTCRAHSQALNQMRPVDQLVSVYSQFLADHSKILKNESPTRVELAAHGLRCTAIRKALKTASADPYCRVPREALAEISGMIRMFQRETDRLLSKKGVPLQCRIGTDGNDLSV